VLYCFELYCKIWGGQGQQSHPSLAKEIEKDGGSGLQEVYSSDPRWAGGVSIRDDSWTPPPPPHTPPPTLGPALFLCTLWA